METIKENEIFEDYQKQLPFDIGNLKPFEKYFTGKSYLNMLVTDSSVPVGFVTFEPGCINNWHIHSGGQILIVTNGEGYYQEFGKPAIKLHKGDVVNIKGGVKHWHGASKNSWFSHLAIEVPGKDGTTWCEAVEKSEYDLLD